MAAVCDDTIDGLKDLPGARALMKNLGIDTRGCGDINEARLRLREYRRKMEGAPTYSSATELVVSDIYCVMNTPHSPLYR